MKKTNLFNQFAVPNPFKKKAVENDKDFNSNYDSINVLDQANKFSKQRAVNKEFKKYMEDYCEKFE